MLGWMLYTAWRFVLYDHSYASSAHPPWHSTACYYNRGLPNSCQFCSALKHSRPTTRNPIASAAIPRANVQNVGLSSTNARSAEPLLQQGGWEIPPQLTGTKTESCSSHVFPHTHCKSIKKKALFFLSKPCCFELEDSMANFRVGFKTQLSDSITLSVLGVWGAGCFWF